MTPFVFKVDKLERVVDGDTVDVVLDLGFYTFIKCHIRLDGFDAPETWRPETEAERDAGLKVKEHLEGLLENPKNKPLYVRTGKDQGGFGRWIGTFFTLDDGDEINLNESVVKYMENNNLTKEQFR